jgi:hypothetical protein
VGTGVEVLLATMGQTWTSGAPARTSPVVKSLMRSWTGGVAMWASFAVGEAYLRCVSSVKRRVEVGSSVLFDHV